MQTWPIGHDINVHAFALCAIIVDDIGSVIQRKIHDRRIILIDLNDHAMSLCRMKGVCRLMCLDMTCKACRYKGCRHKSCDRQSPEPGTHKTLLFNRNYLMTKEIRETSLKSIDFYSWHSDGL